MKREGQKAPSIDDLKEASSEEEFKARLKDWYREERINYAQNAQQRREVIWCNQKTEKTAQQLTLF